MMGLFSTKRRPDTFPELLYRSVVATSRRPEFYRDFGVPDTIDGRFDMIVLNLVLLLSRLADDEGRGGPLGQGVFDEFVKDMDRAFREMGVGDLGMKKRMKRVAESFYGRAAAYTQALADSESALADALDRNFFPEGSRPDKAAMLADHAMAVRTALRAQDWARLRSGEVRLDIGGDRLGSAA